jgi:hypothetical protein
MTEVTLADTSRAHPLKHIVLRYKMHGFSWTCRLRMRPS